MSQTMHNVTVAVDTGRDSSFSNEREWESILWDKKLKDEN